MNFYIAQFFGLISIIFGVVSFQVKDMKKILVCQLGANGFMILNYALLDGISGAGIAFVAVIQSVLIFLYDRRGKKMPATVIGVFMVLYVLVSAFTFKGWIDILPCVAALTFAVSLFQDGSAGYRRCMLFNILLWIGYDLSVAAYTSIAGRIVLLVSIVSAMIRLDFDWGKNSIIAETDRLIIRKLCAKNMHYMELLPEGMSGDEFNTYKNPSILNALIFKKDESFVGRIGMYLDREPPELVIEIMPEHKNCGFGPEAVIGFANAFGESTGATCFAALISKTNSHSLHVFEKLGGEYVGDATVCEPRDLNFLSEYLSEERIEELRTDWRKYLFSIPIKERK